ncbi:peptide-methionine (S)-S-oxide reductase MsrA [Campylobacter troglodytis]|uniref:peptide-methionine (S)-S-oxide reductase MsrA n=1 Tax=Campylobacter troglodytis TaxID=654363 RepID=UPI00115C1216|nr:peptide-methionine (S)-S-oxide reductase MsrA [Campylobacter troglodytis]TQR57696.1 peptide-methionine (S)-S-oxide reductase [Campylobacter troglodytis]
MQIYLAGGCFWGVQAYFDLLKGVNHTEVGYANAKSESLDNLNYELVCSGLSDAVEACRVDFNEEILPLNSLLSRFFSIIDPTSINKQGNDIGSQYRSGIYSKDQNLLKLVREFIATNIAPKLALKSSLPIATEILPLLNFTPAETYHQKYLQNNPKGYCHIDLSLALKPLKS